MALLAGQSVLVGKFWDTGVRFSQPYIYILDKDDIE